jgi:hypothetical protein
MGSFAPSATAAAYSLFGALGVDWLELAGDSDLGHGPAAGSRPATRRADPQRRGMVRGMK